MRLRVAVPGGVDELGSFAQIFRHQFVLGAEMAVERHLVGAGGVGDGLDPHRPDSMPIEQLAGNREDALAGRNFRLLSLVTAAPAATAIIPLDTGVTGQYLLSSVTDQYHKARRKSRAAA